MTLLRNSAFAQEAVRYQNPMSHFDAADPCVLRHGDTLYLYSTGNVRGGGSYPIRKSGIRDRVNWDLVGSIFHDENYPEWSQSKWFYWAPEVHLVNGRYICYFSTRDKDGRFCIGAATSLHPGGPFTPQKTPLVSNPDFGLIDASFYEDKPTGRMFVLWKEDKNDLSPQQPTGICMQELELDGLTLKGDWKVLITNDAPWETVLVEGPSIVHRNGYYYLFFSGNVFSDDGYSVGVARAKDIWGPYEKFKGNPILKSNDRFRGPGHQYIVEEEPGNFTMYYHSRDNTRTHRKTTRLLMSDPIQWNDNGWPFINDGTPSNGWNGWPLEAKPTDKEKSKPAEPKEPGKAVKKDS